LLRNALLLLVPAALGCGVPPDKTAYLLLDASALQSGTVVRVGHWRGAPVTPISVDVGDELHLDGPRDGQRLEIQPGHLAYVRGAGADVTWLRLGEQVREDAVRLDATGPAARSLARQLGAEAAPLAAGYALTGRDLWERLAFFPAPVGLRGLVPELFGEYTGVLPTLAAPAAALPAAATLEVAGADDFQQDAAAPQLVGFYVADGEYLRLDASGGFLLQTTCGSAPVDGTFRLTPGAVILTPRQGDPTAWRITQRGLTDMQGVLFQGGEP
jgi:hypothetical protein